MSSYMRTLQHEHIERLSQRNYCCYTSIPQDASLRYSYLMVWRKVPTSLSQTSTLSPSFSALHFSSGPTHPTPCGVPVMMTVPLRNVVPCDRKAMIACVYQISAMLRHGLANRLSECRAAHVEE